jgi:hypothetical protein
MTSGVSIRDACARPAAVLAWAVPAGGGWLLSTMSLPARGVREQARSPMTVLISTVMP